MNKRNSLIAAACLVCIMMWLFFSSTPVTTTPEVVVEKYVTKPVKVVKKTPPPLKVVPAKKNVAENIKDIRSKQKLHLSAIYTALKSMHADYDRYSTDLFYMGYGPEGEIDFKIGFIKPYYPEQLASTEHSYEDPERMTNVLGIEDPSVTVTDLVDAIDLSSYEHLCKKGCTANEKEFELMVVSPLQNGKHDVWVINENKQIIQVLDGTKK
ncbi:MAG: hypothetical protein V4598_05685 [Bdellovibrionota bacterium]